MRVNANPATRQYAYNEYNLTRQMGMSLITKIAKNIQKVAYIVENPKLLFLKSRGGSIHIFKSLNQSWFKSLDIKTFIDIGANCGQFTVTVNSVFPNSKIYSFEPLPDCFSKLQARMANVDKFKGFNIAVGNHEGSLEMEANNFSQSSSLLKMTELHKTEFAQTAHSKPLKVEVRKLDTLAEEIDICDPLCIKIDVQGYEDRVLQGGEKTIRRAKILIVETSFNELYKCQPLFYDIDEKLTSWQFMYAGSLGQLYSAKNGRILQQDSLFIYRDV